LVFVVGGTPYNRAMGKIAFGLIVIGIISAIVWLERSVDVSVCTNAGSDIYSLTYSDEKGRCTQLSEFKAHIVVINTWASWCPFCVDELPDLGQLAEEFPEVPVVAINRGEETKEAQAFLKSLSVSKKLYTLFDPEDSFYAFIKGFGMPETIFINQTGEILLHKRGVMSLEEMREIILSLQKEV